MTPRERARFLVSAIDSVRTPRAAFRNLTALLEGWRQPTPSDRAAIGAGTQVTLERLIKARAAYELAIDDAKHILEVK